MANGQWNVNPAALIGAGWQRITRNHPAVAVVNEFTGVSNLGGIFVNANTGTINASWWGWQFQTGTTSAPYLATTTTPMGAPRWDYDPETLALRGLLIEEARTNLAFPSTNWKANATASNSVEGVVQNVGVSPSGANDAMAFIPGAFNALHWQYSTFTGAVNTTYTLSVFAKAAGLNFFWIRLDNTGFAGVEQWASFNLSTGAIDSQSGTSARIQSVGNGWYRCAVTATSNATAGATYVAELAPMPVGGFITSNVGNNVSGTWVWGGQIEQGAFVTSYIPTTSAAVTRAVDVATLPTTGGWFNASAGTAGVEFQSVNPGSAGGQGGIMRLDDGGTSNFMTVFATSGAGAITFYGLIGGVAQIDNTLGATVSGTPQRIAYNYGGGLWRYAMGGAVASGSGSATPFSATRVIFGGSSVDTTAWKLNGHLRAFRYWSRALSDAEMQQITANP